MDADNRELIVIGVAMLFFLLVCVVAVTLFVRQWRRERGGGARKSTEQARRP
jgi:hypothetical protein